MLLPEEVGVARRGSAVVAGVTIGINDEPELVSQFVCRGGTDATAQPFDHLSSCLLAMPEVGAMSRGEFVIEQYVDPHEARGGQRIGQTGR